MLNFLKEYKNELFSTFGFLFLSIAIFVLSYLYLNEYIFYTYVAINYGFALFFLFLTIVMPSHCNNKKSFLDVLLFISFILLAPITVPFFLALITLNNYKANKYRAELDKDEITGFHLETNKVFGWIDRKDKLIIALAILYSEGYKLDRIVNTDYKSKSGSMNFGTRIEHRGDIALIDWLNDNKEIPLSYLDDQIQFLTNNYSKDELKDKYNEIS